MSNTTNHMTGNGNGHGSGAAAVANRNFSPAQKEYISGFMAAVTQRGFVPFAGHTSEGKITSDPLVGGTNLAAPAVEEEEATIFGTKVSDLCKQEKWKLERHGLDIWDRLLAHAENDKFPDDKDTFYFRYHGLFYVAPAQNSFMLRCRVPAGDLTSHQMRGLADIAEAWGGGYAHVTTRANIQIREIAPRNMINVLMRLQEIGITSRGSGVDNIRNITATPTAGIDPTELIDTRPFAKAVHYYIYNNRDMYGLPRKFNIAFDGGGRISSVADTNDIGFMAVRVPEGAGVEPGVYFRVELAGITGHKQFAKDAGVVIKPEQCVAVAAAIVRVFNETGDRTNRNKARLKYVIDRIGVEEYMKLVDAKLDFPLTRLPLAQCQSRPPTVPHGHIGVYPQKQGGLSYIGAVITVGHMTVEQMRRMADFADKYGTGELRLTVWQNLLIPNVEAENVAAALQELIDIGFHYKSTSISGGLVACTGNRGCKWSSTDTKGQAVALARHLESKFELDQPINIHLTGCPNSCAQHYMGDIGLLGTKVGQEKAEGYHVFVGGGFGENQAVARQVFQAVAFDDLKPRVEQMLAGYLRHREPSETFLAFTKRHDTEKLVAIFTET